MALLVEGLQLRLEQAEQAAAAARREAQHAQEQLQARVTVLEGRLRFLEASSGTASSAAAAAATEMLAPPPMLLQQRCGSPLHQRQRHAACMHLVSEGQQAARPWSTARTGAGAGCYGGGCDVGGNCMGAVCSARESHRMGPAAATEPPLGERLLLQYGQQYGTCSSNPLFLDQQDQEQQQHQAPLLGHAPAAAAALEVRGGEVPVARRADVAAAASTPEWQCTATAVHGGGGSTSTTEELICSHAERCAAAQHLLRSLQR